MHGVLRFALILSIFSNGIILIPASLSILHFWFLCDPEFLVKHLKCYFVQTFSGKIKFWIGKECNKKTKEPLYLLCWIYNGLKAFPHPDSPYPHHSERAKYILSNFPLLNVAFSAWSNVAKTDRPNPNLNLSKLISGISLLWREGSGTDARRMNKTGLSTWNEVDRKAEFKNPKFWNTY